MNGEASDKGSVPGAGPWEAVEEYVAVRWLSATPICGATRTPKKES